MMTTTAPRTIGTAPVGAATGTQAELRWATITEDDGTVTVTVYRGWGITDEVRLAGADAPHLADTVAETLIGL